MLAAARTQWERAKAFVPSYEQIRQRIAEREKQAGEHGHVPKTQKQIDLVRRKWLRFLDAHGEAYGYDKDAGPTLALVKLLISWIETLSSPPKQHAVDR